MKRTYSLKGRNVIREVYHKGRKLQGSGLRLYFLNCKNAHHANIDGDNDTPGGKGIKIAVILAKSFGKSHVRNRAKRRVRALCTGFIHNMRTGVCIIIRIENGFREMRFEEARSAMNSLFAKAGLLIRDTGAPVR